MQKTMVYVVATLFACSIYTCLQAQPAIDWGLYNTGVNDQQDVLTENEVDPHYELIDPSEIVGDAFVTTAAGGFPIPPWIDDNHLSAWIAPSLDTNAPGDPFEEPNYIFRTTFDLTGVDTSDLEINGQWATDNLGLDILINGESLGIENRNGFGGYTPFLLDFGFEDGVNTLDFVLNNAGDSPNPAGLRVEFEGNGNAPPPPPPPHPHAIASLYPTGVDDLRQPLEGDIVPDPHYQIVLDPNGEPLEAVTVPEDGFPIPPWFANDRDSRWISPPGQLEGHDANGDPGLYAYETTFTMEGKDVTNASIVLARGTDDAGPTVLLNGVEIPTAPSRGFGERSWVAINSAAAVEAGTQFNAGENTLTFIVENGGEDLNPTGLRVDNLFARAAPEGSVRIPGLYNTGVDDDHLPLVDFEPDEHYEMNVAPDGAIAPATALGGPPIPPWAENSGSSRWIGPDNTPGGDAPEGDYEYTIEFDLTDLDHETAVIMGMWSADNIGGDILLNGEPTGNPQAGSFPILSPFEISVDEGHSFLPGVNTLTFLVNNAPPNDNPTGLRVEGLVAFVMPGISVEGDYNRNGILDAGDIDLLSAAVRENSMDLNFDANGDGSINPDDRTHWINVIANTWVGDSNLDLEFNSSDFVAVFQAGEYEDGVVGNSTWATGDWNGDTEFNSSDFVSAFQSGGFERGPRPARAASVPEPSSIVFVLIALFACVRMIRR